MASDKGESVVDESPKSRRQSTASAAGGKKKKGTASAVKASKKKAKAASSSAKLPAAKKKKRGSAGHDDETQDHDDDDDDGSSESDSGPYCICRGPDNHRFMIGCDSCEEWFHGDCIGVDKYTGENLVQRYICPNCSDGRAYVTRYKKLCSVAGCARPARAYRPKNPSAFCSDEHAHAWWDQLVATLPKSTATGCRAGDVLTQEDFMALVAGSAAAASKKQPLPPPDRGGPWKLGDDPFGVPPGFWDATMPQDDNVLSAEETAFLSRSAQDRHGLGEEIVLCKKMLQLVDMAVKRREAAIAVSVPLGKGHALGKDFCGYDPRLDSVGATHAFAAFLKSPAGEAAFRAGKLEQPEGPLPDGDTTCKKETKEGSGDSSALAAATAGMCTKKKCKPHMQWGGVLTKAIKHQTKELAAQAKEKLDAEARVRDGAAIRYRRRLKENNWVTSVDSGSEMDVDG